MMRIVFGMFNYDLLRFLVFFTGVDSERPVDVKSEIGPRPGALWPGWALSQLVVLAQSRASGSWDDVGP